MKYTIELTDKQKKVMDCLVEIIHRYIGFNPKFEMYREPEIITKTVTDPNADAIYEQGYADGKKFAYGDAEFIQKAEYNNGYNSAINDYNAMYEWLHDCFVDFKKFLLEKGFYTDEKFLDGFVVGQLMYDLICDHDIAEVISEFKKWQEEKKKADEIKVGDEVKDLASNNIGVVLSIGQQMIVYMTNINHVYSNTRGSLEKTGRHFDEVEQLLDKLRGEE